MTTEKKPGLFRRVFGNPVVRGVLKSLPVGNLAYEIADTIKAAKDPARAEGDKLPHSPISMFLQAVTLLLILYAFFTHQISIDDVLKWVTPNDFKFFGTLPAADTIPAP